MGLFTFRATNALYFFIALAIGLTPLQAAASSDRFKAIKTVYVFGDSLSDTGNSLVGSGGQVPFPTHYNSGRYSNGPVWADYLAGQLMDSPPENGFALSSSLGVFFESGMTTTCPIAGVSCSYAFGGSGTRDGQVPTGIVPGLGTQIAMFQDELQTPLSADPTALYVIWSGANNYLFPAFNQIFGVPIFGPLLSPDDPASVVADIRDAIKQLTALGARNFLVVNLPDLASVPLAAPHLGLVVEPAIRDQLTEKTLIHNRKLARMINRLNRQSSYTERDIILLDAYTLFALELAKPGAAEAGPASACLLPTFFPNSPCDPNFPLDFANDFGSKIWDEQHPTTKLHKKIGKRALNILKDLDDTML